MVTAVRTDLDPPQVLGYLLPSRSRRELRADRILALDTLNASASPPTTGSPRQVRSLVRNYVQSPLDPWLHRSVMPRGASPPAAPGLPPRQLAPSEGRNVVSARPARAQGAATSSTRTTRRRAPWRLSRRTPTSRPSPAPSRYRPRLRRGASLLKGVRSTDAARMRGRALWYKGDLKGAADELETMLADPAVKTTGPRKSPSWLVTAQAVRLSPSRGRCWPPSRWFMWPSAPYFVVPVEIDGESVLAEIATGLGKSCSTAPRVPSQAGSRFVW